MSKIVKRINEFFKAAIKKDVEKVKDEIILTERQDRIFHLFYVQGKEIDYIADEICACPMVVNKELKIIREKIIKVIDV